jgi:hypothetical protein
VAVLRTPARLYVVSGYHPHSLLALLHFSSQALLESSLLGRTSRESVLDLRLLFIFYQLVRALAFYHGKGHALGNLSMRSVYVSDLVWLRLVPGLVGLVGPSSSSAFLPSPSRPPGCVYVGWDSLYLYFANGTEYLALLLTIIYPHDPNPMPQTTQTATTPR